MQDEAQVCDPLDFLLWEIDPGKELDRFFLGDLCFSWHCSSTTALEINTLKQAAHLLDSQRSVRPDRART